MYKQGMARFQGVGSLINGALSSVKSIKYKTGFFSDDTRYKNFFDGVIGPELYMSHRESSLECCAFCIHLTRSRCHTNCYSCSFNTYGDCSSLLPATYCSGDNALDMHITGYVPWVLRKPCEHFKALDSASYYRNFMCSRKVDTVANYETLEGIYTGLCRGKRPCQICASEVPQIYGNCMKNSRTEEPTPCSQIMPELHLKYAFLPDEVKRTG